MNKRPNVLWIMSDQHNPNCTGYEGNPDVKTPNLDKIAARGVNFTNGFANNPICSPSRICFMTGQYMHTNQMFGNNHAEYPNANPETMSSVFQRNGYQTGLFGKSHMIRRWDYEGFEQVRYTDLCDADRNNPFSTHYFKYLYDKGLADSYEEGSTRPGQKFMDDGSGPSRLDYEDSIEHFTGEETLKFLKEQDEDRPFFIHMSFQRPHAPIAPTKEYFEMYDPDKITLPESKVDWFENKFSGKPECIRKKLENGCEYPLATDEKRLRRCIASYYGLITAIDWEIGRVLKYLEETGELENTIIFYTADHGDFAGEHGLFHKNLGLYESIQRIPYLLSWPGGPQGKVCEKLVESVDLYPTLCNLCKIPVPQGRDGADVVGIYQGNESKDAVYCEWQNFDEKPIKISSVRTEQYRLVFYAGVNEGELYDREKDPGELNNLWNDPAYMQIRFELFQKLMSFTLNYKTETDVNSDRYLDAVTRNSPSQLLHKNGVYWSDLEKVYYSQPEWRG